jgi:hypothetical protein
VRRHGAPKLGCHRILLDHGESVDLDEHAWRQLCINSCARRKRFYQEFAQDVVHLPEVTLFGEVHMQQYDVSEGCVGLFKKLLYVRHRLPKLLVNSVADDARARVSTDLSANC